MCIRDSGNVLWAKSYGGSGSDEGYAVSCLPDGALLVAGTTSSFGNGSRDLYLVKTDAGGSLVWSRTYGGTGVEAANQFQDGVSLLPGGGMLLIGETTTFGSGGNDVYLVRADDMGGSGCNQTDNPLTGVTSGSVTTTSLSPVVTTTGFTANTATPVAGTASTTETELCQMPVPPTRLADPYCDAAGVLLSDTLAANPVNGATAYQFLVENLSLSFNETHTSTDNAFRLDELSGSVQENATYQITVRAIIGSDTGVYADTCYVTTAAPTHPNKDLGSNKEFSILAKDDIVTNGRLIAFRDVGGKGNIASLVEARGTVYTPNDPVVVNAFTLLEEQVDSIDGLAANPLSALSGTLFAGVYQLPDNYTFDGTLTLKGDPGAHYIFKAGRNFTVAATARVIHDGVSVQNVTWVADSNITVAAEARLNGYLITKSGNILYNVHNMNRVNLYALNGSVTFGISQSPGVVGYAKGIMNSVGSIPECTDSTIITFAIDSISPTTIDSMVITDQLSPGIGFVQVVDASPAGLVVHVTGSATTPVFHLHNLPSGGGSFLFQVQGGCDVASGQLIATADVYDGGAIDTTYTDTANVGALQIAIDILGVAVNGQPVTGDLLAQAGDTIIRSVCLKNNGTAPIDSLIFTEVHDTLFTLLDILNLPAGDVSFDANNTLSAILHEGNLLSGGWAQGDTLKLEQLLVVNACDRGNDPFGTSTMTAKWGCEGSFCDSSVFSPDISTPALIDPILTATRVSTDTFCYDAGVIQTHTFTIFHDSALTEGAASNLVVQLFKPDNINGSPIFTHTQLVHDSYTVQFPDSSGFVPVPVDSIRVTTDPTALAALCSPLDSIIDTLWLTVPYLATDDTLRVSFQTITCEPENCGGDRMGLYGLDVFGENSCGDPAQPLHIDMGDFIAAGFPSQGEGPVNVLGDVPGPTDTGGVVVDYVFDVLEGGYGTPQMWPSHPDRAAMLVEFELPWCLYPQDSSAQQLTWVITDTSGMTVEWTPSAAWFNDTLNTVSALFPDQSLPPAFLQNGANNAFAGSQLIIKVKVDCRVPRLNAQVDRCDPLAFVNVKLDRVPDTLCLDNTVTHLCEGWPVFIQCPGCLRHGLFSTGIEGERTTLGLKDYNDNRQPDSGQTAEKDSVRVDRAMLGDTIRLHLTAYNQLNGAYNPWTPGEGFKRELTYGYHHLNVLDEGEASWFELIGWQVDIYDNSKSVTQSVSLPLSAVDTSGAVADFVFDYSLDTLAAYGMDTTVATGIEKFDDNDTLHLYPTFVVVENVGNDLKRVLFGGHTYLGVLPRSVGLIDPPDADLFCDTANNTSGCDMVTPFVDYDPDSTVYDSIQYYCEDAGGVYYIAGYSRGLSAGIEGGTGCGARAVKATYQVLVGDLDNPFPNEFRHFSRNDSLWFTLPEGVVLDSLSVYDPVADSLLFYTAAGFFSQQGDTVVVDVDQWYSLVGYGKYLDDTYGLTFRAYFTPHCGIPYTGTADSVFVFTEGTTVQAPLIAPYDTVTALGPNTGGFLFFHPEIFRNVTSNNPTSPASSLAVWDMDIVVPQSAESADALNNWIGITGGDHLSVEYIYLPVSGDTVTGTGSNGNIFPLGDIALGDVLQTQIVASYTDCNLRDTVTVLSGWNCTGYPVELDSLPCEADTLLLILEPVEADLSILPTFTPGPGEVVRMCDSITYALAVDNTSEADMRGLMHAMVIPSTGLVLDSAGIAISFNGGSATALTYTTSGDTLLFDSLPLNSPGELLSGQSYVISWTAYVDCDYDESGRVYALTTGVRNCGTVFTDTSNVLLPASGLVPPDTLSVAFTSSIGDTGCNSANSSLSVEVTNDGSLFSSAAFVVMTVPDGLDTVNVQTAPDNASPAAAGVNYAWEIPGINPGATYTLDLEVLWADTLCGDYPINVVLTYDTVTACANPNGITCDVVPYDSAEAVLHYCQPFIALDSLKNACPNIDDGYISVSVTGGSTPYTYNWGGGLLSNTISDQPPGTYDLQVTDSEGCSAMEMYRIRRVELTLDTNILHNTCFGIADGTAEVIVNYNHTAPPFVFDWAHTSLDTAFVDSLTDGEYAVTVTDIHACMDSLRFEMVNQAGIFPQDSGTGINCYGELEDVHYIWVFVEDSGGGLGQDNFDAIWPDGDTTDFKEDIAAGFYQVSITALGCVNMPYTFEIVQPDSISVEIIPQNPSCNGESDGAVTLVVAGGTPPYSYQVSNGGSFSGSGTDTIQVNGLTAGTWTLNITDNNGCTLNTSFDIDPTPLLVTDNSNTVVNPPLCNGSNDGTITYAAEGGTSPYAYFWNTGNTGTQLTGLDAGTYTVSVTDTNGCELTDSFVLQDQFVLALQATVADDTCSSASGFVTITPQNGTAPYTYLWSNGATTNPNTGLVAGNYTATVTDANGCYTEVTATVSSTPGIVITASVSNASCLSANGQVIADASSPNPPYTYLWDDDNSTTGATLSNVPVGIYTVSVQDAAGCFRAASFEVDTNFVLLVNAVVTDETCSDANGSIALTPQNGATPYTYQWDNGATSNPLTGLSADTFSVVVNDTLGCTYQNSFVLLNDTDATPALADGVLGSTVAHLETVVNNKPFGWEVKYVTDVSAGGKYDVEKLIDLGGGLRDNTSSFEHAPQDGCRGATFALLSPGNTTPRDHVFVHSNTGGSQGYALQDNIVYMLEARVKIDNNIASATQPLEIEMIAEPRLPPVAGEERVRNWKLNRIYDLDNSGDNEPLPDDWTVIRKCFTSEAFYSDHSTSGYNGQTLQSVGLRFYTADSGHEDVTVNIDGIIVNPIDSFRIVPENDGTPRFLVTHFNAATTNNGLFYDKTLTKADFDPQGTNKNENPEEVYHFRQVTVVEPTAQVARYNYDSDTTLIIGGALVMQPLTHFRGVNGSVIEMLNDTAKICLGALSEIMVSDGGKFRYAGGQFELMTRNACVGIFEGGNMEIARDVNMDIVTGFLMMKPTTGITMRKNSSITARYGGRVLFRGEPGITGNINLKKGTVFINREGELQAQEYNTAQFKNTAKVVCNDGGRITIANSSDTITGDPKLAVKDGGEIILKKGSITEIFDNGKLEVRVGGRLVIEDGAELIVHDGGVLHIKTGGEIVIENTTAGKGILLADDNSEFRIDGTVTTADGVHLGVEGNGFIKFKPGNVLNLGTGSNVVINGNGKNDKVVVLTSGTTVQLTAGHNLDVRNGKIKYNSGAILKVDSSNVFMQTVKLVGTSGSGTGIAALDCFSFQLNDVTAKDLEDGVQVTNNTLASTIVASEFENCTHAIVYENTSSTSFIANTTITGSNYGVTGTNMGNATFTGLSIQSNIDGIVLNGANVVNTTDCDITALNHGANLTDVNGFYLVTGRIHNCVNGIFGQDAVVFLREAAIIEQNNVGIFLVGTTPQDAMITMGDLGCGSVIDNTDFGIFAQDVTLNIDAVQHAVNRGNPDNVIPNSFDNPNATRLIEVCYSDETTAPSEILARGNYWRNIVPNPVVPPVGGPPLPNQLQARANSNCTQDIPFNTDDFSVCVPDTSCLECEQDSSGSGGGGGILRLAQGTAEPGDSLLMDARCEAIIKQGYTSTISDEYETANEVFIPHDTLVTRQLFTELAKMILTKQPDGSWIGCHPQDVMEVQNETIEETALSNQCVQLIQVAKVLVKQPATRLAGNTGNSGGFVADEEVNAVFGVYPNPNEGTFVVTTDQEQPYQLVITDITGKVVWKSEYRNDKRLEIELDNKVGVYFVALATREGGVIQRTKIVIH